MPATVAAILERRLGLSADVLGPAALDAAVRGRLSALGSPDPATYAGRLADPRELAALVEAVVVPETWFFRYPASFRFLAEWAVRRPRPVRVLSVPCSTGEEPYSIAATLLDAGLSPGEFEIDAADVSERAVDVARRGSYPRSAFRGETPGRHWVADGERFAVSEALRQAVRFRVANLLDPLLPGAGQKYDAIFCRNLLIYLTADARRRVFAGLEGLLAADGVLFMGHAEPATAFDPRFRSVGPAGSFAFGRGKEELRHPTSVPKWEGGAWGASPNPPTPFPKREGGAEPLPSSPPPLGEGPGEGLLDAARRAADRGDLVAAVELCGRHLATNPPTADAFALLGSVHAAAGQATDAEQAFTRALYLDPGHYDSLLHRMAAAQARGDATAAANFRRRADAAARREGRP